MTYYHGTTDRLKMGKVLLSPETTGIKREDFRNKYGNKVFFTTSLMSSSMYAKKACNKYGGNPVVYIVKPIGLCSNTMHTEYISDKALIVGRVKEG